MISLQTIEAFGMPYTEMSVEDDTKDTYTELDQVFYLSVDPSDTQTGLHLGLQLLNNEFNTITTVDCLCQATDLCKALLEAAQVVYEIFPPADYTIKHYWIIEDMPF